MKGEKDEKTFLITAVCAMILPTSSIASGAEGPYVRGNLGLATLSDSDVTDSTVPGITTDIESDLGLALGVAAGYAFRNNTRIEGEIAYQKNDLDKMSLFNTGLDLTGDTSSLVLLLNGYYDFANESAFTPFISAGLGFAKVEVSDMNVPGSGIPDFNDSDTVFAYQLSAGAGYAVNERVTFDVKYRFSGLQIRILTQQQ